ncbi:MAG: hypothetical protein NVS2B3_12600 [Vulcanimicrobiaceae bacterium]
MVPGTNEPAELDARELGTIAQNGHGTYVESANAETLRRLFRSIALATVWEHRHVDGSLGFALGGGLVLVGTFLGALATGKL